MAKEGSGSPKGTHQRHFLPATGGAQEEIS